MFSLRNITLLSLCIANVSAQIVIVYEEDFSDNTLLNSLPNNGYVGFWNNNVPFDEISVAAGEASISGGELLIESTSAGSFRGIAIVIDPLTFSGQSGTYNLSFDISTHEFVNPAGGGSQDATANVSIWSGSGYDTGTGTSHLLIQTQAGPLVSGTVQTGGSASAMELASGDYTATASNVSLAFDYTSGDAVVLFFGATAGSFPFERIGYDNISLTSSVPEPSSYLLSMLGFFALCLRRRKYH